MVFSAMQISAGAVAVQQKKAEIVGDNLAVVDNEGNTAKHANVEAITANGNILGVRIGSVSATIDRYLEEEVLSSISKEKHYETLRDFQNKIQSAFGSVGGDNSVHNAMTNLFNELTNLSGIGDVNSRDQVKNKMEELTQRIRELSTELQQIRLEADQKLGESFREINAKLADITSITGGLGDRQSGTEVRLYSETELSNRKIKLAEYFPISSSQDHQNGVVISTSNYNLYHKEPKEFHYEAAGSIDTFVKNEELKDVYLYDARRTRGRRDVIVRSDSSEEISHRFGEGRISALLKVRDEIIPNTLAILDNHASMIREEFNKIHNGGSGYPPVTKLTGTNLVARGSEIEFKAYSSEYRADLNDWGSDWETGIQAAIGSSPQPEDIPPEYKDIQNRNEVAIHFLQDDGKKLEFGSVEVPPLLIPLETMETEEGKAGRANVHGIAQHIENYNRKLTSMDRLTLQNGAGETILNDLKLVSKSREFTGTTSGTNFEFDLELDNTSGKDLAITDISIMNVVGNGVTLPAANFDVYRKKDGMAYPSRLPGTAFNSSDYEDYYALKSGNVRRTGANQNGPILRLKDLPAAQFPYTIDVAITVKEPGETAGEYITTVSFTVDNSSPAPDSINQLINRYFAVTSTTNTTDYSNPPALFAGSYTGDLISASVVSEEGSVIDDSAEKGFLRLSSGDRDWRFAIEGRGSKHTKGSPDVYSADGTDRGFSHYYGMNDLVVRTDAPENWGETRNSAHFLDIREDIKSNPGNFAAAQLSNGEVSIRDNSNLLEFSGLKDKKLKFSTAGGFVGRQSTIQEYMAQVIKDVVTQKKRRDNEFDNNFQSREILQQQFQSLKGVNADREIITMMQINQVVDCKCKVYSDGI